MKFTRMEVDHHKATRVSHAPPEACGVECVINKNNNLHRSFGQHMGHIFGALLASESSWFPDLCRCIFSFGIRHVFDLLKLRKRFCYYYIILFF